MSNFMTNETIEHFLLFVGSIVASSGFWMYMIKRMDQKDLIRKLLIGLAHDRIVTLSMEYIKRGSVTQDEYEDLCSFLYEPYMDIGGNGTAKRLMAEVNKLPVTKEVTRPVIKQD